MTVINNIGHGCHEKIYENALCIEMEAQGIPFAQQPRYPVHYRSIQIGEYVPDLVVNDLIVVDTKTIELIGDHEIGKMLSYLRVTNKQEGLLINFKHAKLKWRTVWNRV
ncbi:MAG: GxxExxY protein [Flavobacteriales bacterium]|nr:GxxExxY protein [Flavobacteriales bacterium]